MEKILPKKAFPQWIKKLDSTRLYFPVKVEDRWSFEEMRSAEGIDPEYTTAVQGPKKLIFPQKEIFLEFAVTGSDGREELEVTEILPRPEASVVFGVRPCDGKASSLMDLVFGGDISDPYYWTRKNAAILVGLACNTPPSPNCFCLSVEGSPHGTEGLDILLTDLGETYYVKAMTEKGKSLLEAAKDVFKDPSEAEKKAVSGLKAESEKKLKRKLSGSRELSGKMKGLFEASLWDEESMSCIRCGICTYLCPSCHCFDISDEVESPSPLKGKRIRTWDNCQFPDFTMHSSGHNPRPDKASRLRQRLYHKFRYFIDNYDKFQCVGCGRCITHCPVGIDIIKVLEKVRDHGA